jgi:hypothetical protein
MSIEAPALGRALQKLVDSAAAKGIDKGVEHVFATILSEPIIAAAEWAGRESVKKVRDCTVGDPVIRDAGRMVDLFGPDCGGIKTDTKVRRAMLESVVRSRRDDPALYPLNFERYVQCVHNRNIDSK